MVIINNCAEFNGMVYIDTLDGEKWYITSVQMYVRSRGRRGGPHKVYNSSSGSQAKSIELRLSDCLSDCEKTQISTIIQARDTKISRKSC